MRGTAGVVGAAHALAEGEEAGGVPEPLQLEQGGVVGAVVPRAPVSGLLTSQERKD